MLVVGCRCLLLVYWCCDCAFVVFDVFVVVLYCWFVVVRVRCPSLYSIVCRLLVLEFVVDCWLSRAV